MLEVRNINTFYDTSHILQGVTLEVGKGEIVAVLGRNGVGKTTLVRSIVGVTPPRSGSILFQGRDLVGLPPHVITGMGIALVPQGRRVFASLSVQENLALGLRQARSGGPRDWTLPRVHAVFPILRERQDQPANALSGGEQQMLACARALLSNPDLLLMDEPSEGLAPQKVRELALVIAELRRGGLAVLLVEQKLSFAIRHADRVYVLSKGQIAFAGTPAELRAEHGLAERLLGVAPS